ncbi:MAG: hypothetical protein FRX48_00457 [Lasallia pustulata]|uniref:Uncharacterized protein n=1 Tax=Lasallia pustulata TaxID=136370 RepID=A0A5M8Q3T3_9LECA|nr:MAG: hypothetical protein FRX48_00457 [Lasallia pustulata]
MADAESKPDTSEQTKTDAPPPDTKEGATAPEQPSADKGFLLSSYGATADSKMQSVLSPVGKPLGTGLQKVAQPVGSIVGSVVDSGIMAGGRATGAMMGVGAGSMDTDAMKEHWEKVKKEKREEEELEQPLGGEEQTGENPLGL